MYLIAAETRLFLQINSISAEIIYFCRNSLFLPNIRQKQNILSFGATETGFCVSVKILFRSYTDKCLLCDLKFKEPGHLKDHITALHGGIKKFACDLCSFKGPLKGHLTQHINRCHPKETLEEVVNREEDNINCCECSRAFRQKGDLIQHMRTVHFKFRPIKCDNSTNKTLSNYKLSQEHYEKGSNGIKKDDCIDMKNAGLRKREKDEGEVELKGNSVNLPIPTFLC